MHLPKPKIPQGDTQSLEITVRDKDGIVSLAGVQSITWRLCLSEEATAAIITKTLGSGLEISDESGGQFLVHLEPADTVTLPARDYFHQARIVFSSGAVKTIVRQYLTIVETV